MRRLVDKVMSLIMVMMIVFGAISGGGVGSNPVSAASDFSGEGSASKPYLIGTANQLNKVRDSYLDGNLYFKLTGPIDLSSYAASGWVPIGTQDTPFKGHLDGNGYQITGLTIHSSDFAGLFGSIGNGSSIANVKLDNVSIHGGYAVGALVGLNDRGTIENSFASGSVSGDYSVGGLTGSNNNGEIKDSYASVDVSGGENIGGLVGDSYSGTISGSHAAGIVSGNKYIGGLVGYKSDGTISSSYASGNVSLVASTDRNAGGLVGYNENGTISNSYSTGKVRGGEVIGGLIGSNRSGTISDSNALGDVSGSFVAGGLVGNASYGKITNSYAAGNVSLLPNPAVAYGSPYAGGLVASNNNGEISGSHATGNVSGTDESYSIGGLIGKNDNSQGGNILNSYATGHVNGGNSSFQVGGLIGSSTSGTISYSYATGNVNLSGSDLSTQVGGLVGDNNGGTISHSFATGEVSGRYNVGGLVGSNDNYESGEVKSSYASGQVSGSADSEYVGGLVGWNRYGFINDSYASGQVAGNEKVGGLTGQNGGGMITNSYATGQVSGSIDVGGLVGERLDSHLGGGGVAINSFYDMGTTGQMVSAGGLGQSTVQMQTKSIYEADNAHSWDFANIWAIDTLHNNGYPYLPAIQVYLDYDGNGSTSGTVPMSRSFMPGVKASIDSGMINLIKSGYVFNGWNTQADGSGISYKSGDSLALAANTTLYAKWIVPNSNATLTSTIGNVSTGGTASESITDIPYGTTLAVLKAAITPATGAVFEIYDEDGITAATRLATGKKVIVTATDGTTKTTYTVNVKANDAKDIMAFGLAEQTGSAVIDATAHTVEIEVMSGTSLNNLVATFALSAEATVKVGTVDQISGTTANDFTNPVTYMVKAGNGTAQSWKVTLTKAIGTEKEITAFSFTQQTGPAVIDAAAHTIAIQVANGTSLISLKAAFTLSPGASAKVGTTDQVSGMTANNFTGPVVYVVKAENGMTQNWTVTVTAAFSSAKAITAFSFPQQTGPAVIDANAHTIAIQVAYGTNVSSLRAVFTLSPGASAKVGSRGQISNSTVNNFTNPVTYLVRAADDSTQNWIVTVNVAAASSAKDLTAFSFQGLQPAVVGTISGTDIALTVPNGTAVTSLVATFTSSAGSTVKVGTTTQVSGTTATDFTSPVTYIVTAQDGTMASYTVVVTQSAAPGGNPTLSGLMLTSGGLTLIADSVTGTTYHFNVNNQISSINVTASVYDSNSNIKGSLYNSDNVLVLGPFNLINGQTSQSLPLEVGTNRMELVVTAQDGSNKTYLVYVNRASAAYSNAQLTSLQVSDAVLAFNKAIFNYTLSVGNRVDAVKLNAFAEETQASVTINTERVTTKDIQLNVGSNLVAIEVTAQDGKTKLTYSVNIRRAVVITASSNSTIQLTSDPVTIAVPIGVTNAKIAVTPVRVGSNKEITLPLVEVFAETSEGQLLVAIPEGTKVTAPGTWDGTLKLPEVQSNSSVSISNSNVSGVLEIGSPDVTLTFDKAVRLFFPKQGHKLAGYVKNGAVIPITGSITSDTQAAADDEIAPNGEARITVGEDLVVWTKHFTTYVFYLPITPTNTSEGGGGGGGSVGGPSNVGTIWAARGGTLILNGLQIDAPLGAVDSDTQVTVNKSSDTSNLPTDHSMHLASEIYEITTDKAGDLIKAVILTLPFDKAKVDFSKSVAALYGLNEKSQKWEQLDDQQIDQTKGTVSGSTRHFTKFAVLATDKKATTNPPVEAVDFSDIKGHWAEASIRELVQLGAINGYSDHTFKPNDPITRAEFVTVIVKAFHLQAQTGKAFVDTEAHWARSAIEIAASLGIVTGYSASTFGPDDLITREQMAVMIIGAAQIVSSGERADSFKDSAAISDWARTALAAATAKALLNGYEDGTVKPKANTTRAEAAAIILRALQLKK
ncbi:GLUG motif-containing protein [Paenibacillus alba]|uniref:GLUG motif-containing protein n=1 Tax=Paenibacillus alba TaxID=1197127 RepID=A0ABU6G1A9_9BACL|nr:GLUG motif-containing protein [Paenibacillus alba]MEC0227932.1 GLUG motif-containing protein [Paenibacillus alba]